MSHSINLNPIQLQSQKIFQRIKKNYKECPFFEYGFQVNIQSLYHGNNSILLFFFKYTFMHKILLGASEFELCER